MLTFISPADIKSAEKTSGESLSSSYYSIGPGFFTDHGRPAAVYKNGSIFYFWASDWEEEVGGTDAIGNSISIYNKVNKIWEIGQVIAFNSNTDCYTITIDSLQNNSSKQIGKYCDDFQSTKRSEFVVLRDTPHTWLLDSSTNNSTQNPEGIKDTKIHEAVRLSFSQADVGKFIRVWWTKYRTFFYGRVIKYDAVLRRHDVIYSDGDARVYDLLTRKYEVLFPPDSLALGSVPSDTEASAIVAAWHQGLTTLLNDKITDSIPYGDSSQCDTEVIAVLPPAGQSVSTSCYLIQLINQFFTDGGFTSIFKYFSNTLTPAPSCAMITLYLKFLYQLRPRILHSSFCKLVWEAKEVIPIALMRFEDIQLKDVTKEFLQGTKLLLRDIILATSSNVQHGIAESVELLQLGIASRLLQCSQLQKRYYGLSLIKEAIELSSPQLALSMRQRSGTHGSWQPSQPTANRTVTNDTYRGEPMSPVALGEWLVQHSVVEGIFGGSLHQDLAARSDLLLAFMATRR